MKEIWKNIIGYEGKYQISNIGRIKSLISYDGEKILKLGNRSGYKIIGLFKNGKQKNYYIHRLVAYAFIIKEDGKEYVNHIDGNKTNNKIENLEWITASENNIHAYQLGLIKKPIHMRGRYGLMANNRTEVNQYTKEGEFIKKWNCIEDIKRDLGINNVSAVCRGLRNTAGGYKWKYIG